MPRRFKYIYFTGLALFGVFVIISITCLLHYADKSERESERVSAFLRLLYERPFPDGVERLNSYQGERSISASGNDHFMTAAVLYKTKKTRKEVLDYYEKTGSYIRCDESGEEVLVKYLFMDSKYWNKYGYISRGGHPKAGDLKSCGNLFECHEFIRMFDLKEDMSKGSMFYVTYAACEY